MKLSKVENPKPNAGVQLRHWNQQDISCVIKAGLDSYIPQVTTIPVSCDERQAKEWIQRQSSRIKDEIGIPFCIADQKTNKALGMIGIFRSEDPESAHCGYWVIPEMRGRDLSGKALKILSSWAFKTFPIRSLELFIEPNNTASMKTAKSCGYTLSKTLIAHQEIGGVLRDMHLYVLANPKTEET
jgi:ribosomal-protein-alanine N-acetyltransferase